MAKPRSRRAPAVGAPAVSSLDRVFQLKKVAATARGASWACIGAAAAVLANELLRQGRSGIALADSRIAGSIGTAIAAGIYGVFSRTSWSVRRCLMRSQAMFLDGLVTERELASMKKKCLDRWA